MLAYFPIIPVAKPRMTRADSVTLKKLRSRRPLNAREKKRAPILQRWLAFCDEVKIRGVSVPEHNAQVIFLLPMPRSWTNERRAQMLGQPHRGKKDKARKNDVDNLGKSLLDAVYGDDSGVWDLRVTKVWSDEGGFFVLENEAVHIPMPFDRDYWLRFVKQARTSSGPLLKVNDVAVVSPS